MDFIAAIEAAVGKTAQKELREMQAGDVPATYADIDDLVRDVGFRPGTPLEIGIRRFVEWFKDYYHY
jgi:UDP-glucuronate 4-epimerase